MKKITPALHSFLHALLLTSYIVLVVLVLFNAEAWFGDMNTILGPMAFLMLLVLSVAISGVLMFGKPILMYLDNKKTEAIRFFGYTILWFSILMILVFATQFIVERLLFVA
ncbi:MAG: hypothetical protein WC730_00990 [Patescibacteria group bacterium]|jgi:hypothetical protein